MKYIIRFKTIDEYNAYIETITEDSEIKPIVCGPNGEIFTFKPNPKYPITVSGNGEGYIIINAEDGDKMHVIDWDWDDGRQYFIYRVEPKDMEYNGEMYYAYCDGCYIFYTKNNEAVSYDSVELYADWGNGLEFEGEYTIEIIKGENAQVLEYMYGNDQVLESDNVINTVRACSDTLTAITIPESVTSIGDGAFTACSSLQSVTIPESVTSIGGNAFGSCLSLQSVTIPESVTSIGGEAFSNCSSLQSVTIPESVTSIDFGAFANCSSLQSIVLNAIDVNLNDGGQFSSCNSLTDIEFGSNIANIPQILLYDIFNDSESFNITFNCSNYEYNSRIWGDNYDNRYYVVNTNVYVTSDCQFLDNENFLNDFNGAKLYIDGDYAGVITNGGGEYYYEEDGGFKLVFVNIENNETIEYNWNSTYLDLENANWDIVECLTNRRNFNAIIIPSNVTNISENSLKDPSDGYYGYSIRNVAFDCRYLECYDRYSGDYHRLNNNGWRYDSVNVASDCQFLNDENFLNDFNGAKLYIDGGYEGVITNGGGEYYYEETEDPDSTLIYSFYYDGIERTAQLIDGYYVSTSLIDDNNIRSIYGIVFPVNTDQIENGFFNGNAGYLYNVQFDNPYYNYNNRLWDYKDGSVNMSNVEVYVPYDCQFLNNEYFLNDFNGAKLYYKDGSYIGIITNGGGEYYYEETEDPDSTLRYSFYYDGIERTAQLIDGYYASTSLIEDGAISNLSWIVFPVNTTSIEDGFFNGKVGHLYEVQFDNPYYNYNNRLCDYKDSVDMSNVEVYVTSDCQFLDNENFLNDFNGAELYINGNYAGVITNGGGDYYYEEDEPQMYNRVTVYFTPNNDASGVSMIDGNRDLLFTYYWSNISGVYDNNGNSYKNDNYLNDSSGRITTQTSIPATLTFHLNEPRYSDEWLGDSGYLIAQCDNIEFYYEEIG